MEILVLRRAIRPRALATIDPDWAFRIDWPDPSSSVGSESTAGWEVVVTSCLL